MASGVKVSDEVFTQYGSMKLKKEFRYMEMRIESGFIVKTNMMKKSNDQKKDYEDLVSGLKEDTCCYILLDMDVPGKGERLYVITWCPDNGKTKDKMVYAASKSALHDKIGEGCKLFQANDISDLDYENVLSQGK